ncbi:MAG TPA: rod shape-determining protein MreD [Lachnospiraceae bacterium]|nr:rod shape-determining protein MreD [Lachnospiraceae bacterium]
MLRRIVVILMIIIGYLLQTTLFKAITLAGIVPNILLIITSAFGFMRGKNEGMFIGFFSGLLIDIFFGKIIGFYALVYLFIGFVNGFFRRIFYPEDIKLPMILIGLSDLLYCFLCYIFLFMLRGKLHLGYYFVHVMLPEVVYTVLVTLILYKGILYIDEWLEGFEKG